MWRFFMHDISLVQSISFIAPFLFIDLTVLAFEDFGIVIAIILIIGIFTLFLVLTWVQLIIGFIILYGTLVLLGYIAHTIITKFSE